MEARKFGFAAGIGGVLFCIFAIVFVPGHHTFGLIASIIAGMAGGYLSYEFRDVLRAIPTAWGAAWKGSRYVGRGLFTFFRNQLADIREYFSRPHPLLFQPLLVGTLLLSPVEIYFGRVADGPIWITLAFLYLVFGTFGAAVMVVMPLAFIGARFAEKKYWRPMDGQYGQGSYSDWLAAKQKAGLTEASITHANLFRWQVKGFGLVMKFLCWTMWKYIAIGTFFAVKYLALGIAMLIFLPFLFVWKLIKLIHSTKRSVCAIYGTIGGVVSYLSFVAVANTLAEKTMLVLCGGIFGAALGIAGREVVAKRLLHMTAT
jgi:hypothetical protein